MLVLSRKQGESVQIDSTIQVTVVSIAKGRVKLGISAPGHVHIVRDELRRHEPSVAVMQEEMWSQQVKDD